MTNTRFSLKSRLASFKFAFNGLRLLLRNEHNSRIHLVAAVITAITGFLLKIDRLEWIVLAIVIALVFITELFNSSLESVCDVADNNYNEKIGRAKDYAAAAVLIAAIISVIAGGLIFIPKIVEILK
jgi:diacylglycerol kinase (ATP)